LKGGRKVSIFEDNLLNTGVEVLQTVVTAEEGQSGRKKKEKIQNKKKGQWEGEGISTRSNVILVCKNSIFPATAWG